MVCKIYYSPNGREEKTIKKERGEIVERRNYYDIGINKKFKYDNRCQTLTMNMILNFEFRVILLDWLP